MFSSSQYSDSQLCEPITSLYGDVFLVVGWLSLALNGLSVLGKACRNFWTFGGKGLVLSGDYMCSVQKLEDNTISYWIFNRVVLISRFSTN
jgi:hypothetical protein